MAIPSLVQFSPSGGSLATQRTYPTDVSGWSAPAVGNIVIVCLEKALTSIVSGPVDWIQVLVAGTNPTLDIWYRVIDGTETTHQWSWSGNSNCTFHVREFTAGPGARWLVDPGRLSSATATAAALSTGFTGALTTASAVLVTLMGGRTNFSAPAVAGGPPWTSPTLTNNGASAHAIVDVSTSAKADWTWTTSVVARVGIVAFYAKYPRSLGGISGVSVTPSTTPVSVGGVASRCSTDSTEQSNAPSPSPEAPTRMVWSSPTSREAVYSSPMPTTVEPSLNFTFTSNEPGLSEMFVTLTSATGMPSDDGSY